MGRGGQRNKCTARAKHDIALAFGVLLMKCPAYLLDVRVHRRCFLGCVTTDAWSDGSFVARHCAAFYPGDLPSPISLHCHVTYEAKESSLRKPVPTLLIGLLSAITIRGNLILSRSNRECVEMSTRESFIRFPTIRMRPPWQRDDRASSY